MKQHVTRRDMVALVLSGKKRLPFHFALPFILFWTCASDVLDGLFLQPLPAPGHTTCNFNCRGARPGPVRAAVAAIFFARAACEGCEFGKRHRPRASARPGAGGRCGAFSEYRVTAVLARVCSRKGIFGAVFASMRAQQGERSCAGGWDGFASFPLASTAGKSFLESAGTMWLLALAGILLS